MKITHSFCNFASRVTIQLGSEEGGGRGGGYIDGRMLRSGLPGGRPRRKVKDAICPVGGHEVRKQDAEDRVLETVDV